MSAGADIVYVRGLRADALIGVHPWERELRQTLVIDLEMAFPIAAAARSDRLEDTLDYHAVSCRVREIVEASECLLIEALAERIAGVLLSEFGLRWLRLGLAKPGAVPGAVEVGVRIERSRSA